MNTLVCSTGVRNEVFNVYSDVTTGQNPLAVQPTGWFGQNLGKFGKRFTMNFHDLTKRPEGNANKEHKRLTMKIKDLTKRRPEEEAVYQLPINYPDYLPKVHSRGIINSKKFLFTDEFPTFER